MYLKVNADMAEPLLERLQPCRGKGFDVCDGMMQGLSEAGAGGWPVELEARVHSAPALGLLLHHYLAAGAIGSCESPLEAVIRKPVPPKAVRRLVPLSQANVEARDRRERERSVSLSEDDT
jgi:hypothetical protein